MNKYTTHLRLNCVATLLTEIHKVQDAGLQVGHSCDTLHLDRVHLLEGMIQNTRRVNHLPAHVAVVEVADKERLGRERVRLHVDVRAREAVARRRERRDERALRVRQREHGAAELDDLVRRVLRDVARAADCDERRGLVEAVLGAVLRNHLLKGRL